MKWNRQEFLNPADSRDSGWIKFSVETSHGHGYSTVSTKVRIADCSRWIDLDFHVDVRTDSNDPNVLQKGLDTLDARRRKISLLLEVIDELDTELHEAYEEVERKLQKRMKSLDKSKKKK